MGDLASVAPATSAKQDLTNEQIAAMVEALGGILRQRLYDAGGDPIDFAEPAVVHGTVAYGSPDDGGAPIKAGGHVAVANPSAMADGSRAEMIFCSRGTLKVSFYGADTNSAAGCGTSGDNTSNATNRLATRSLGELYNITGAQQVRSANAAKNTDALGVSATGIALWANSDLTALRINNSASASQLSLVAGVASQTTRIHSLRLNAPAAVTVTLKCGSTVKEVFDLTAGGLINLPLRDRPYFKSLANEAVTLDFSAAVQVNGVIEYYTAA